MKVLALQNCVTEGFGLYERWLEEHGVPHAVVNTWRGEAPPAPGPGDAILVGGTPASVCALEEQPCLVAERDYLRAAIARGTPVLGVCFGSQLLAHLLGAEVRPNPRKELGGSELRLTAAGLADPLLRGFPERFPVFQWHGDTFSLPAGATLLVEGEDCRNQMFRHGAVVGVQFHFDVTAADAAAWADAYGDELAAFGKSKAQIVEECRVREPAMRGLADRLLGNFFAMARGTLAAAIMAIALVAPTAVRSSNAATPARAYLGQALPGDTPALFAPDFVSTDLCERDLAITPDGREIYFTLQGGPSYQDWFSAIVYVREQNGLWTPPRLAPFSGRWNDVEPFVTSDGKRLYFSSNRPPDGNGAAKKDYDIWVVERTGSGWGAPRNLGPPVNTAKDEFYPTLTRDGTLYVTASYDSGRGGEDIWRARPVEGGFAEPENLGDSVNTAGGEYNALIAPDESWLILGRDGDLFIGFRRPDGSWTSARNMGPGVNAPGLDYCPALSPDGRQLFFTSTRWPGRDYRPTPPGFEALRASVPDARHRTMLRIRMFPYEDIYWVSSGVIGKLREEALR